MQLYLNYKCTGECKSGVLLRAKKAADGMTGVFVSLADGDTGYYSVALDASGKETSRDRLSARTWRRRRSAGRQRRSWWCARELTRVRAAAAVVVGAAAMLRLRQHRPHRLRRAGRRSAAADAHARP